jgi:hypothetical protein
MASGGPQFPTVSINEDDIAKIAIAVKQLLVHEFNNIIDEKQKPIIDEIAKLKQDFSNLELNQFGRYFKYFGIRVFIWCEWDATETHALLATVHFKFITFIFKVVESIKLKNTDTDSQLGIRTATITYTNITGNESVSATCRYLISICR